MGHLKRSHHQSLWIQLVLGMHLLELFYMVRATSSYYLCTCQLEFSDFSTGHILPYFTYGLTLFTTILLCPSFLVLHFFFDHFTNELPFSFTHLMLQFQNFHTSYFICSNLCQHITRENVAIGFLCGKHKTRWRNLDL